MLTYYHRTHNGLFGECALLAKCVFNLKITVLPTELCPFHDVCAVLPALFLAYFFLCPILYRSSLARTSTHNFFNFSTCCTFVCSVVRSFSTFSTSISFDVLRRKLCVVKYVLDVTSNYISFVFSPIHTHTHASHTQAHEIIEVRLRRGGKYVYIELCFSTFFQFESLYTRYATSIMVVVVVWSDTCAILFGW